jgi:hypothetical protein
MAGKIIKMSVNLPDGDVKVLKGLVDKRGVTMTAVLRQAISIAKFIDDAHEDESKILIEDKKGRFRQLVYP